MQINRFAMSKPVFRRMIFDHINTQVQVLIKPWSMSREKVHAELQKLDVLLTKAITEDVSQEYDRLKEALGYHISAFESIESDAVSAVE